MISTSHLVNLASNKTVLYVEDDEPTRKNITYVLESIFSNVLVASNGEEGLQLSKKHHIDLVISDILMPKINGLEMVKEIKKNHPYMPVILITAFDNPQYLLESIDLSINKYLLKPLNKEKLYIALEEVLYIIESREKEQDNHLGFSKTFKMISIVRLLDNLSHQWRQSLSIISTSISSIFFLDDLKVSDPEVQKLLNNANNHITKMDNLLKDIICKYKKTYQYEYVNLYKSISDFIETYDKTLKQHNIKITLDIPKDIEINTHVESLHHITNNLLDNSIDAIESKSIQNGEISISTQQFENEIILNFIDNGGGINNFIKDDIFEPYTTTKHNYIGTGLGLYMVYILVTKALKGTICATNFEHNDQRCTKFSIALPLKNISI